MAKTSLSSAGGNHGWFAADLNEGWEMAERGNGQDLGSGGRCDGFGTPTWNSEPC